MIHHPRESFTGAIALVVLMLVIVLGLVLVGVVVADWAGGHEQTLPAAVRAFFLALDGTRS